MGLLCQLGCRLHKVYLPGTLDLMHLGLVLDHSIFIGLMGVKMFPVDPGQSSNFPRSQGQEFVSIRGPCGSQTVARGPGCIGSICSCLLGVVGCTS